MIFVNTLLNYTLFSSILLFYGIGLNKTVEIGITKVSSLIFYVKSLITIFSTASITWLLTNYILTPINLIELFPLLCILLFICINIFVDSLIRLTSGITAPEYVVSLLIILISIFESTSFLNTTIICLSGLIAIIIMLPLGITFKKRICNNGRKLDERYYSLFFFFLAIIIIVISVFDTIWLQKGVIK
ncbi:MAG: hypothetical protein K6C97_06755 [Treponema sp.]|nr:hypothetical protein [Treponema sp.]